MIFLLTLIKVFLYGAAATCGVVAAITLIALAFSATVNAQIDKIDGMRREPAAR